MNRHFLRFKDLPPTEISPLLYRADRAQEWCRESSVGWDVGGVVV